VHGEADQSGDGQQQAPASAKRGGKSAERQIARHGAVAAREAAKGLAGTDAQMPPAPQTMTREQKALFAQWLIDGQLP
jgi:hypothetical protein